MTEPLPSFKDPPVVESVLGLQFEPLDQVRNAHLAMFWQSLGADEWPDTLDAHPLEPVLERFGRQREWLQLGLRLAPAPSAAARLQIKNAADDRMIQIQNGRFHYNWRKTDQSKPYPRYETVRREFDAAFAAFTGFLASHQLGKVRPTQWEVTYVNLIEQGPLWSAAASWPQLLPGLLGTPGPATDDTRLESFDGTWHFELASERGRLHVSLRHTKRSTDPNDPELIRLELTARGPVGATGAPDLDAGLNLGHEAIVKKFAAVTSPAAHKYWGRQL